MELRQLRYFVTLAHELHFRKAAEALNITQPPLSQAIKLLEEEIGAPLLERGRKRLVRLTPAGKSLYASATQILKEADHAKRMARGASHGETGVLTIGHTDDYIYDFLPELLFDFNSAFPETMLRFYLERSLSLATRLLEGEFDCIFTTRPVSALLAECEVRPLPSTPIVLAVPKRHRLSGVKKIKLKEIIGERHLYSVNDLPSAFDRKLSDQLSNAGIRINSHIQPASTLVALEMVRRGYGVMFATKGSIANPPDISLVTIDEEDMDLERALVWRKDNANPTLRNFLNLLENVKGNLGGRD